MNRKYFVNEQGQYIGCSTDPVPPEGGVEVPTFPRDAISERWDGESWVDFTPKAAAIEKITVTIQSNKTFDGNETAINRMASAIMIAERINQSESEWKMADNTKVMITLDELKEAHTLAMMQLGEIVLTS